MESNNRIIPRKQETYELCFGCGQANPIGLKLKFRQDGDKLRSEFIPDHYHQGWPDIVHGGVINALIDEALSYPPFVSGLTCFTGKIEVRFRQPAWVGQKLLLISSMLRKRKRVVEGRATITREDGTVIAEGTALMYVLEEGEPRSLADQATE